MAEVNPQFLKSLIHEFRGTLVMLDADLAAIYGYSTKAFNLQVKHNIERFDEEDLMFQLNEDEVRSLRFNFSTSNENESSGNLLPQKLTSNRGGRRYAPYAFTEQGVYMLMSVLKGPMAVKQSKALVRLFKQMKDYIVQNQSLLGEREYLQLSMQTTENVREIIGLRAALNKLDDKVAKMADDMGHVVTKSQLFNREDSNIRWHIGNIFREGELDKANNVHFLHVIGVKKPVPFYNSDVIISVGYRVHSTQGILFRKWVTSVLKDYRIILLEQFLSSLFKK